MLIDSLVIIIRFASINTRIAVFKQVLKLQLWSVIAIAQNLRTDHAGYFIKKHILISKFKVLLPLRVLQQ